VTARFLFLFTRRYGCQIFPLIVKRENLCYHIGTALDGELAVPCNPQSASAGSNSRPEAFSVWGQVWVNGVEDRVLRNGNFRTVSGPDGSSTKEDLSCAVGVPGLSRLPRSRPGGKVEGGCAVYIARKHGVPVGCHAFFIFIWETNVKKFPFLGGRCTRKEK
jgi:hypothetical protein